MSSTKQSSTKYTYVAYVRKAEKKEPTEHSVLWRAGNGIMTIFLVLAAYVQLNDPDPIIWVPMYMAPALLSFSIAVKPQVTDKSLWRWLCLVHMTVCIGASFYVIPTLLTKVTTQKIDNPLDIEEGREMGGMFFVIIWLFICRFSTNKSMSGPRRGWLSGLMSMAFLLALMPLLFWYFYSQYGKASQPQHCKGMFPNLINTKTEL